MPARSVRQVEVRSGTEGLFALAPAASGLGVSLRLGLCAIDGRAGRRSRGRNRRLGWPVVSRRGAALPPAWPVGSRAEQQEAPRATGAERSTDRGADRIAAAGR